MYEATIGLEIHAELKTKSKMFCRCANVPLETRPNINVCPVCLGHPGTLPVINKEAVKMVVKVAQSLRCEIARQPFFERKNYFYPDLPKAYQISQYQVPMGKNGKLKLANGEEIKIERVHLEEDTGKLIHPEGKDYSLVDFNRAGVPLMEMVTFPVLHTPSQVRDFVKEFQLLLRYLGVSDADMEKGQMRVEVNISLSDTKSENGKLGTKVEIKNLNSIKAVEKAIEYEISRQSKILDEGGEIVQETRGWHDKKQVTFSQRQKEKAHDYRYFPDPDLPPLDISDEFLNEIKKEIPELAWQKRERFSREYGLNEAFVEMFVFNKSLADYFEKVMTELREWIKEKRETDIVPQDEFFSLAKLASSYILTDVKGYLNEHQKSIYQTKLDPENFAEFVSLIYLGEIPSRMAKNLLPELLEKGGDPTQILENKGVKVLDNEIEVEEIARKIIEQNPKAVQDYRKGKTSALQFLIGQMMRQTQGTVRPDLAKSVFEKLLTN